MSIKLKTLLDNCNILSLTASVLYMLDCESERLLS